MYTVVKDNANNYSINSKMISNTKTLLWLPPSTAFRVIDLGLNGRGTLCEIHYII